VIKVSLPIENNGEYDGREIVQIYVSKQSNRPLRPRLELVSFEVVNLKSHEKRLITLNIASVNLAYENEDPRGEYKLFIGPNSVDTKELTINII
jgi:beta-glucosidase